MNREQELQAQVDHLSERLHTSEKDLEAFLYAISHDLRGPLRAIMSSSMILIEDFGSSLGSEGRAELERQARAAKKLAAIIEEILKVSRLGRQEMKPEAVDLSKVVHEIVGALPSDLSKGGEIVTEPGLSATGDPKLLRVLLGNLIDNSLKFCDAKRKPSIQVGRDGEGFFICDNGIGITDEHCERIFMPFERLNGENEYPGLGMGLTAARLIVQRHGGKIWARPNEDVGVTIWFTFPGLN